MMITEGKKLPNGWRWVTLAEVCRDISDGTHFTPTYVSEGIPFLSVKDVRETGISFDDCRFITEKQHRELCKRCKPERGDVLYTKVGTTGIAKAIDIEREFSIFVSVALLKLRPDVIPEYMERVLNAPICRVQAAELTQGAANRNLVIQDIKRIVIPLPSLAEQKRIAAIAQKADRLRGTRRYALQLSDTYLQSVFLEMFGDPIINSMGWDRVTLSDIKTDCIYGTSTKCYPEPNGLPVLRIPNILGDEIDISNLKYAKLSSKEIEQLSLREGDLLFVRTNGNLDYVGRSAVFNLNDSYLFASYLIRARLNFKKVNPWFVSAYLRTSVGRQVMSPFIRTTAGQFNISVEGLKQIVLPLPPLPLQEKFAQIVQKFERLRTQQREAERQAEHLFQTLLHRAFRGELTPQGFNDEPASVLLEEIGAEQTKAEAEAKAATQAMGDAAEYLGSKAKQQDKEFIQLKLPGIE
ncbi:restriction endonuclease subunit S [Microcoleus sp. FACHB-53]|nr:restriction endonuclease subunit S [Microcoleus sp. FACHB-53]